MVPLKRIRGRSPKASRSRHDTAAALVSNLDCIIQPPRDSDSPASHRDSTNRTKQRALQALQTALPALVLVLLPLAASASLWDWFASRASASEGASSDVRTIALLTGNHNPDPELARGGGDISIVDGTALAAETNPLSEEGFLTHNNNADHISLYVVREGDTLSEIASMFGVTNNTIRWANDLGTKGTVHAGDKLVILPITGVKHVVKKGDTLASLSKRYKADKDEIAVFNGLEGDASLTVGLELIIPGGEVAPAPAKKGTAPAKSYGGGGPAYAGYYMRPIKGGLRTQGIHGYNGVDLASSYGASVYASAAGEVIISRADGGYNGGYGNYIVLRHDNGTQTLYAHLSENHVSVGQTVAQGEVIGAEGSTGRSTGTHLHFEIRGAANPF
jgi:LysM repeat protein